MAYTIYEYVAVTSAGEPIQPASIRTVGCDLGEAIRIDERTVYAAIVSDVDMHLRVSADGATATDGDHKLAAGDTYGFPVRASPYVYGVAA